MNKIATICLCAFFLCSLGGLADYTETLQPGGRTIHFQRDSDADGNGLGNDSVALQRAIDAVARWGGGQVDLAAGTYRLAGIQLKSNVHLFISNEATLIPVVDAQGDPRQGTVMFTMGGGFERICNTSIRGVGGRFVVEMPSEGLRTKFLVVQNVDNFLVDQFHIQDQQTVFSSISLNPLLDDPAHYAMPENGTIRNGSVTDAQYGYGLIQAQAGRSIHFENLSGVGGVTLRLETGSKEMNDKQYGGVWEITAKNIRCKDGHAALLMGPHSIDNGVVVVDGVYTEGCAFAMKGGDGFVSPKQSTPNLKPGMFAEGSTVKNIHAVFGTNAQLKTKDVRFVPKQNWKYIQRKSEAKGKVGRGPSVTAVFLHGKTIQVEQVTCDGMIVHPAVITADDLQITDPGKWLRENNLYEPDNVLDEPASSWGPLPAGKSLK